MNARVLSQLTGHVLRRHPPIRLIHTSHRLLAVGPAPPVDSTQTRTPQTVSEKVRAIIYPSNYDKISKARTVLQDTRITSGHVGMQLAMADKHQLQAKREKLNNLLSTLRSNREPLTAADYNEFLEGYMETRDPRGGLSVLVEMRRQALMPTTAQYNIVLKTAARDYDSRAIFDIGEEMRIAGVPVDADGYATFFNQLLLSLSKRGQPELAYSVYQEMQQRKISVHRNSCHELICALGSVDEVDIAFEILRNALANALSFDHTTNLSLLRAAGASLHHDAFRHCFEQLVHVFSASLAEGDYIMGLNVAARHGDTTLAAEIISAMQGRDYALQEHHFEPLLESLVRRAQWLPAFRVLHTMRAAGHGTGPATVRCLTRALIGDRESAEQRIEHVYTVLFENRDNVPLAVSTETLNALVAAMAESRCPEATADRMDRWFSDLDVPRNIHTYERALKGCELARNKTIAEVLFTRLLDEDHLEPSQQAYEAMLATCLTQYIYEDAFVYLESMKAHDMVPGWKIYSKIVRRCARVADPRAQTAMQEMREIGYAVPRSLSNFVATGGKDARHTPTDRKPSAESQEQDSKTKPSQEVPDLETLLGNDAFKL